MNGIYSIFTRTSDGVWLDVMKRDSKRMHRMSSLKVKQFGENWPLTQIMVSPACLSKFLKLYVVFVGGDAAFAHRIDELDTSHAIRQPMRDQ